MAVSVNVKRIICVQRFKNQLTCSLQLGNTCDGPVLHETDNYNWWTHITLTWISCFCAKNPVTYACTGQTKSKGKECQFRSIYFSEIKCVLILKLYFDIWWHRPKSTLKGFIGSDWTKNPHCHFPSLKIKKGKGHLLLLMQTYQK